MRRGLRQLDVAETAEDEDDGELGGDGDVVGDSVEYWTSVDSSAAFERVSSRGRQLTTYILPSAVDRTPSPKSASGV